jgi:hypothetical protein
VTYPSLCKWQTARSTGFRIGTTFFLPPKADFVVVTDDAGHVFVLPLLTMTGLSYESEAAKTP